MEDIRKVVGSNVLRLRRERGISQEELSFRSGFGRAYLSGLERGRRNPTVVTVSELASALEATVHDLTCHAPADFGGAPPASDGGRTGGSTPQAQPRRRRTRPGRP